MPLRNFFSQITQESHRVLSHTSKLPVNHGNATLLSLSSRFFKVNPVNESLMPFLKQTIFPQNLSTYTNTSIRMISTKTDNIEVNQSLNKIRVAFRTPITQLADDDRPAVQAVVDAATTAINQLKANGLPVDIINHQVLTKTTQKTNLTQKTPKAFRIERLYAVRASDVFIEIVLNKSLSLSGAVERGYAKALRDLGKRLTPGEKALVNEKFPARVFQGFGRSIVVMHNGKESFGGPLITTLYKQDPDTDYIYIKYENESAPANLAADFPDITIIDFNQEAMINAFTELLRKQLKIKQAVVNEKMADYVGLAPTDDTVYINQTPKPRGS